MANLATVSMVLKIFLHALSELFTLPIFEFCIFIVWSVACSRTNYLHQSLFSFSGAFFKRCVLCNCVLECLILFLPLQLLLLLLACYCTLILDIGKYSFIYFVWWNLWLNVLVAWFASLIHIQQVLGSNIDPKISYFD